MTNESSFKKYGQPIIVLVVICLVVTTALAAVYAVAAPIIAKNEKEAADKARTSLLAEADSFSLYDGELWASDDGKVEIEEVYVADNGAGMVLTVVTKSFGGGLTEMVGIDATGVITGVTVTKHADTPGVGDKAQAPEHLAQYEGKTEILSTAAKGSSQEGITYITGASVSSNAIHYGVYGAMQQFQLMGGVQ